MMPKKVAIIGANSYIARNMIKSLKWRNDISVLLYDKDETQLDNEDNYQKIDLCDLQDIQKFEFECEIIYMFTGKTGAWQGFESYNLFIDINERMLLSVLTVYCMRKSQAKIIFPLTRLVYKGSHEPLSEDGVKEFKTVYALNKFACKNYLKMYHQAFDVQYCIFRICVPCGSLIDSMGSYGTVGAFVNKARSNEPLTTYGDGQQKRTFTNIVDLCNVLWLGAITDKCLNDVCNIGGDTATIKEIAEAIANVYHVECCSVTWPETLLSIESGDTVFDASKLDAMLHYTYRQGSHQWINAIKEEEKMLPKPPELTTRGGDNSRLNLLFLLYCSSHALCEETGVAI